MLAGVHGKLPWPVERAGDYQGKAAPWLPAPPRASAAPRCPHPGGTRLECRPFWQIGVARERNGSTGLVSQGNRHALRRAHDRCRGLPDPLFVVGRGSLERRPGRRRTRHRARAWQWCACPLVVVHRAVSARPLSGRRARSVRDGRQRPPRRIHAGTVCRRGACRRPACRLRHRHDRRRPQLRRLRHAEGGLAAQRQHRRRGPGGFCRAPARLRMGTGSAALAGAAEARISGLRQCAGALPSDAAAGLQERLHPGLHRPPCDRPHRWRLDLEVR